MQPETVWPEPRWQVWDARDPLQAVEWEAAWDRITDGDPFSHPAFVAQCADTGEVPMCAVLDGGPDAESVLYAFLLRPILSTACGRDVPAGTWDVYTPLPYGGPISRGPQGAAGPDTVAAFWNRYRGWATGAGVVSEFVRMSPVPTRRVDHPGSVTKQAPHIVREFASVDGAPLSADALRMDMASNVRRGAKKAAAVGVTISVDETGERLDEFLPIYYETMDRAGAADRFYFTREHFTMLHRSFPGHFAYVFADLGGRAVSVILVLMSEVTGYYYLGGTRTEALRTYCNVLAQYEAIQYARSRGLRDYVLTGGVTNSADDSLLRFKRMFAPGGSGDYLTGSQIFDEAAYQELSCSTSRAGLGGGYFPAYRSAGDAAGCTAHVNALTGGGR